MHRLALGDQAERAVDRRVAPGRARRPTVTVPRDGARKPAIMCSSVVLPAPLGPSRPVTPGPSVMLTSLTATTLPYQREL